MPPANATAYPSPWMAAEGQTTLLLSLVGRVQPTWRAYPALRRSQNVSGRGVRGPNATSSRRTAENGSLLVNLGVHNVMTAEKRPRGPRLTVNITSEIIERSKQANSKACMIAEAIKEAFPAAKAVSVDLQTCRFTDTKRGLRYVYLTPRSAQKPLIDFDQGISPEPFETILKNAHVLRIQKPRDRASEASAKSDPLAKRTIRQTNTTTAVPAGGRSPPQMRITRIFGVKAFQGFSGTPPVKPSSSP